jgi:hypothetical protein
MVWLIFSVQVQYLVAPFTLNDLWLLNYMKSLCLDVSYIILLTFNSIYTVLHLSCVVHGSFSDRIINSCDK